jgi:hypothetical protein
MKASLGLSGKSFTDGKIMIERDGNAAESMLCPEEKDMKKL